MLKKTMTINKEAAQIERLLNENQYEEKLIIIFFYYDDAAGALIFKTKVKSKSVSPVVAVEVEVFTSG